MKRFKSFLIVFFAIFVFVLVPTFSQAAYFSDVPTSVSDDFFDAINYMSDNGFMVGDGNGRFLPNKQLSRGACVTILYAYSRDTGTYTHPFTDVNSSMYYNNAVAWAYQKGIVSGTSATTFSPDTIINRQQLMIILYAYATNILDKEYTDTDEISSYSDYSNVSSYAITAVNWAKCRNILPAEESDTLLSPKKAVSRDEAALFIWRFQRYVEIFRGRDEEFFFDNSLFNFYHVYNHPSDPDEFGLEYYISNSDMDKMETLIYNYYGNGSIANNTIDTINLILNVINTNRKWGGSCYGMSVSVLLDKLGIIAFNENFSSVSKMYSIPTPVTESESSFAVESAINFYQFSQFLDLVGSTHFSPVNIDNTGNVTGYMPYYYSNRPGYTNSLESGISLFVDSIEEYGSALFAYTFSRTTDGITEYPSHAIVAYGFEEMDDGTYRIYTYDNNYPNKIPSMDSYETYLEITNNSITHKIINKHTDRIEEEQNIVGFQFDVNLSGFKNFDIDGIYNDLEIEDYSSNNSTSSQQTELLESASKSTTITSSKTSINTDKTIMFITAYSDFTLTNAEGKTLTYTAGGFAGDMELYSCKLILMGEETQFMLEVPTSDSYNLDCENEYYINVWGENMLAVYGDGAESVLINTSQGIEVYGDTPTFNMQYSLNSDVDIVKASGTGTDSVSISFIGDNMTANGISSDLEITYINRDTWDEISFTKPSNESTVNIDCSMETSTY